MSALQPTPRGRGRGRQHAAIRSSGDPTGFVTTATEPSRMHKGATRNAETAATSPVGFADQANSERGRTGCNGIGTAMAIQKCRLQNNTSGTSWNSSLDGWYGPHSSVHESALLPNQRHMGHAAAGHSWKAGHRASPSRTWDYQSMTRANTACTEGDTASTVHDFQQPRNTTKVPYDLSQSRARPARNSYYGSPPGERVAAPAASSAGPSGHWGKGRLQAAHLQYEGRQERAPLAESPYAPLHNTRASFESRKPGGLGCTPSAMSSTRPPWGEREAFVSSRPRRGGTAASAPSGRMLPLYAHHLHENCPGLPPVADIAKRLQEIQAEFQRDHLSIDQQCSITDTDRCWILDHLRTFNRILVRVDLELKEEEPQRLCICSLDKAVVAHSNSDWVFDACILFHLLLKRHRCIQTLNLDRTVIASGYPQVLYDALACNRSLRHLAITCWDFLPTMARPLVYSLCRMPNLKSVSISLLTLTPDAAGRIGDMLGRVKNLRSVQLRDNELSFEAGRELMKGLSRNGNLEVIRLDSNALGPDGACFLGELLAKSVNLRELSLRDVPGFDEQHALAIVDGLRQNDSLHKLELHGCRVPVAGVDALAEVLTKGVLKSLVLSSCSLGQAQAKSTSIMLECNKSLLELDLNGNLIDDVGAVRLAKALQSNQSLEKLNLQGNWINSQGVVALIDALEHNTVLKELNLGCVKPGDYEDNGDVVNALDRAVAYDRVRLCYDTRGILQLSANLLVNAHRVTSVHLDSSVELNAACLQDLFFALASVHSLEDLCIETPATIDCMAARHLARVLIQTTTLRILLISECNMDTIALTTVLAAMETNKSVLHLDMDYSTSDAACTNAFVAMVRKNRTLTHFGCVNTNLSELQVISQELLANYSLTTFKIWERQGIEETVFEINEILRRNISHLNRTVEYALYPKRFGSEPAPALAFLDACQLRPFRNHLTKVAGSEAAADKAVRNARRHVQFHLFAITGVCKVPVRCWPHPTGACQIDRLNPSCWQSIFSYLDIADIHT